MGIVPTALGYRQLLRNLVARDLKSRYRGSALGLLWTVLTPLFMALIYVFFLRLLGAPPIPSEAVIVGVFAWQFTVQSIQSGLQAITGNSNLVKKIYFPRIIIPLSTSLSALINYLLMLVVQLGLVAVLLGLKGEHLPAAIFAIPAVLAYHFLFNFSLALFTAAANVYFRDTQHFVGLFLSAWFFISPVMYPLSLLDALPAGYAWMQDAYMANPMALIITAYRCLHFGEAFPWSLAAVMGWLWPMVLFAGAYIFFQRSQRYFADWL